MFRRRIELAFHSHPLDNSAGLRQYCFVQVTKSLEHGFGTEVSFCGRSCSDSEFASEAFGACQSHEGRCEGIAPQANEQSRLILDKFLGDALSTRDYREGATCRL